MLNILLPLLLIFLPSFSSQQAGEYEVTAAERLQMNLFQNYSNFLRPAKRYQDPVIVYMELSISQIVDIDEKNQILETSVWLNQNWTDYRLQWDPEDYDNIDSLVLPNKLFWVPDMALYNSLNRHELPLTTYMRVYSDGTVSVGPPTILLSPCQMNMDYFPFDIQNCSLRFGAWEYHGNEIVTRAVDTKIPLEEYIENSEWVVLDTDAFDKTEIYPCCPYPYITLTYSILLKRKSLYYIVNLVTPCFILTLLVILMFYLPSQSGEKLTLGISILLALSVLMLLVAEQMPPTAESIPLIAQYYLFSTIFVMTSICSSVFVLNINFRTPKTHNMHPRVRRFFLELLPKYIFMKPLRYVALRPTRNQETSESFLTSPSYSHENTVDTSCIDIEREGLSPSNDFSLININNQQERNFNGKHFSSINFSSDHDLKSHTAPNNYHVSREEPIEENGEIRLQHFPSTYINRRATHSEPLKNNSDVDLHLTEDSTKFLFHRIVTMESRVSDLVEVVAGHINLKDNDHLSREEWRYLAQVVDRIFLIIYTVTCIFGSLGFFIGAPEFSA